MVVVGEAATGAEAIALHGELQPDLAIIDMMMPDMGGVEVILRIRADTPDARLVVLSSNDHDELAERALRSGALAYLSKESARNELVPVLRAAIEGRISRVTTGLPVKTALTLRERDVLRLIAAGSSNRVAAEVLNISEETVKTHLIRIRQKLGARDRAHAVALALSLHEIAPSPAAAPSPRT